MIRLHTPPWLLRKIDVGARDMVASEAEGRAEALRRIAACRTAQSEELDLGGLQLTALDGEILAALCQLSWLRQLFLGLSAEARENPQLAFINEEKDSKVCNALGALPGALFDALTALTSLDLSLNSIGAEGAQALKGLVNLTSLDLLGNGIGAEGAQALKGLVHDIGTRSAIGSFSTRHGRSTPSMPCSTVPRRASRRSSATMAASAARS
jgi:hypothetical protein